MDYYKDYLDRLIIEESDNGNGFSKEEIANFFKAALSGGIDREYNLNVKPIVETIIKELDIDNTPKSYKLSNTANMYNRKSSFRPNILINKYANKRAVNEEAITEEDVDTFLDNIAGRLLNTNNNRHQGFIYEALVFMHIKKGLQGNTKKVGYPIKKNDPVADLTLLKGSEIYYIQCKWKSLSEKSMEFNNLFGSVNAKVAGKENKNGVKALTYQDINNYMIASGNRYKSYLYLARKETLEKLADYCSDKLSKEEARKDGITSTGNILVLKDLFFKIENHFNSSKSFNGFEKEKQHYKFSIDEDIKHLKDLIDENKLEQWYLKNKKTNTTGAKGMAHVAIDNLNKNGLDTMTIKTPNDIINASKDNSRNKEIINFLVKTKSLSNEEAQYMLQTLKQLKENEKTTTQDWDAFIELLLDKKKSVKTSYFNY